MITQIVVKRLLKPADPIVPSLAVQNQLPKPVARIVPSLAVQINPTSNAVLTALNPAVIKHNY